MPEKQQSAGRRLSVITVDQAVAGASNVLIAVLAARVLGVESFGFFGIVFLVYMLAQGVARALIGEPVLVHPVEAEERPGDAIGTACLLGIGLGVLVLLSGLIAQLWDGRLGSALMVLALLLPLLLLQDLGRYLGFATHRPAAALLLDSAWLVLLFAGVTLLFVFDARSLAWFIVAWGGSGAVAGLLLFWQYRGHRVRLSLAWLRETWTFSWRYLLSYTSTQGSGLAATVALGGIAGARALGGVQGTLLLVRPFMTVQLAAVAAGIAEISHGRPTAAVVRRQARNTSAIATAIALVNLAVMLALPDSLGRLVLGETWAAAEPLLLPAAVQIVLIALMTGTRAGLLGLRAIRKAMVIDVAGAVALMALTVVGAYIDGAAGALWAVAIGQGLGSLAWWLVFWRHTADEANLHADLPDLPEDLLDQPGAESLVASAVPGNPLPIDPDRRDLP